MSELVCPICGGWVPIDGTCACGATEGKSGDTARKRMADENFQRYVANLAARYVAEDVFKKIS